MPLLFVYICNDLQKLLCDEINNMEANMIRLVETENGQVRGLPAADPRITSFKGIPFAAPPTGENRWRAPQPCANWDGILDAYKFAPISVQDTPGIGDIIYNREWHVDPEIEMNEDCLYLNVWTNAKGADDKLPVLVWFFGGGLQWGYTSEMEFDGERIARRGIVVVTVNYRLNCFGFMAHKDITAGQPDAPANFGSLDQQAGLKWVIRNIHAFGGDAKNITIAGQSAGGGSVLTQMASPTGIGLFQKAVVMSGLIRSPYMENPFFKSLQLKDAEECGQRFLDFLGVSSIKEARQLDAFYIRDKYAAYTKENPRMGPVVDGCFNLGDPLHVIMNNPKKMVPLMVGNTKDEFLNFISAASDDEFTNKAKALFGDEVEKFLSFKEAWQKDNDNNYASISGLELSAKALFEHSQSKGNDNACYYYKFDADIPGWDNPGTFHSVDLWFFFETLAKCWRPFTGRHYDLARQMCNYLSNFIKNGNPNGKDHDGSDLPEWKPYEAGQPCEMVFTSQGAVAKEAAPTDFEKFAKGQIIRKLVG
jgi:para-nitrobenzyl esterase